MIDRAAQLEAYFKGLADVSRLRILNLLLYGELCGCDIQIALEMTQSNVSRHLTYLKHMGLAADRREGFRVFYRLADSANSELKPLFGFLRGVFTGNQVFQNDLVRLERAIREGACRVQPVWSVPQPTGVKSRSGPRAGRV
ncbi:MAG: helix-turn-helix transcriptional regulator [Acidobacteria bacterium]|nr:helix-turn-helix transcriptional regulator [Acidobacteriota bacterium]